MAGAETIDRDTFSVSRARQMLALLDREPDGLSEGDPVPRGWHSAMFAPATRPSALRPDGFGGLGIELPPTDLPRLMFGGRRVEFRGDIAIGAATTRRNRLLRSVPKQGSSGRLLIVTVQRELFREGESEPVVVEEQDFILREPAAAAAADRSGPGAAAGGTPFVADAAMLFRFCALTFNTHRIHYDLHWATAVEGYPALVVNGSLTTLMLTELYRAQSGAEPRSLVTRNLRPLFCGRENRLRFGRGEAGWRLWAEDEQGRLALEAAVT